MHTDIYTKACVHVCVCVCMCGGEGGLLVYVCVRNIEDRFLSCMMHFMACKEHSNILSPIHNISLEAYSTFHHYGQSCGVSETHLL